MLPNNADISGDGFACALLRLALAYLCQRIRVKSSGSMGVSEAVLPAVGASNGRVLRPPQRVVSADRHGHRCGAAAALWAVQGRSQALTPPQQQLPGAEVTRHRWRAALHHAAVPVIVVRAAEGAAE